MDDVKLDWETCLCWDLGYQLCLHYENWCDEMAGQEWWDKLPEEMKQDLLKDLSLPSEEIEDQTDWPF